MTPTPDNHLAILSFLAAPAVLTNASTVLALGTANRLARAADRARTLAAQLRESPPKVQSEVIRKVTECHNSVRRTQLLVQGLRLFYLSAGCFALTTCLALIGAVFSQYSVDWVARSGEALTMVAAVVGVGSLVAGSLKLVAETRLALNGLHAEYDSLGDDLKKLNEDRPTRPINPAGPA